MRTSRVIGGACGRRTARSGIALACCIGAAMATGVAPATAKVIRVGTFAGKVGQYTTIQAAVNAASTGDWILIGPGDYKETGNQVPTEAKGDDRAGAAVLVTKAGVHIRGMDRNGVVLDGRRRSNRFRTPRRLQRSGPAAGATSSVLDCLDRQKISSRTRSRSPRILAAPHQRSGRRRSDRRQACLRPRRQAPKQRERILRRRRSRDAAGPQWRSTTARLTLILSSTQPPRARRAPPRS